MSPFNIFMHDIAPLLSQRHQGDKDARTKEDLAGDVSILISVIIGMIIGQQSTATQIAEVTKQIVESMKK